MGEMCCGEATCCDKKTTMCCGKGTACCPKVGMCCGNHCPCDAKECLTCVGFGGRSQCKSVCLSTQCCINGTCTPKPAGKITSWRGGPPTQVQMTFRDAAKGLATVSLVKACNVTVDIPSFEPGTKDPVVATLTKIDQTQPAHFALKGCSASTSACCINCDPVATTLKLNTGRWARQRFGNIGETEYFVSVENGHLGLQELTIQMNEKLFELRGLSDGEERNLNLSSAMIPGTHNVVILTGRGEVGTSATIMISDTKAETGLLGATAAEIPGSRLSPGNEGRRAHPNVVWGELTEEAEETSHLAFAESSGQTVQLTFGGRIDIRAASEPSRYEAEVNGSPVRVESVDLHVEVDSTTVTLRLADGKLRTGDDVVVFWDELLNETGHSVSGRTGRLVVRSLQ